MKRKLRKPKVVFAAFVCVISTYLFLAYKEYFSDVSKSVTEIVLSLRQAKGAEKQGVFKCQENNTECIRFSKMMKSWPTDKPRAVIYVITKMDRQERLVNMLGIVDRFFIRQFHYPVIIFHTKDFRGSIPSIRNKTNLTIFFQEIEFKIPDFLPPQDHWPKSPCRVPHTIGYKHMCRFQSKLVTEEPIIEQLDYIWRLDDDSNILSPIKYDVFRFMRDNDMYYGYMCIRDDYPGCVFGLWDAARKYIEMKQIKPYFFKKMVNLLYYNNFEISKVSLWTSPEYKDYIDYIDRQGGIYYHRWGDAPIKTIGVTLFVPENKTHHFGDISYHHQTCVNKPSKQG